MEKNVDTEETRNGMLRRWSSFRLDRARVPHWEVLLAVLERSPRGSGLKSGVRVLGARVPDLWVGAARYRRQMAQQRQLGKPK